MGYKEENIEEPLILYVGGFLNIVIQREILLYKHIVNKEINFHKENINFCFKIFSVTYIQSGCVIGFVTNQLLSSNWIS